MMQYGDSSQQGNQGICPPGWHLPKDEEWKVLEGVVDSQYRIGNEIWNERGNRGFNAATNLKTTYYWNENGNGTDLFGFSGLPGGCRSYGGGFEFVGIWGLWWTSNTWHLGEQAWERDLLSNNPKVIREYESAWDKGFSVRYLRDG
jgi:uncharacterized protein (TIGR02145 family)